MSDNAEKAWQNWLNGFPFGNWHATPRQGFIAGHASRDAELADTRGALEKAETTIAELCEQRSDALIALVNARQIVDGPHPANSGLDSFTLAWVSAALGDA